MMRGGGEELHGGWEWYLGYMWLWSDIYSFNDVYKSANEDTDALADNCVNSGASSMICYFSGRLIIVLFGLLIFMH